MPAAGGTGRRLMFYKLHTSIGQHFHHVQDAPHRVMLCARKLLLDDAKLPY
jgi:hypothetical protein